MRALVSERESATIRTATRAFGAVNLLIGVRGFFGPAVTGNDDRPVNIEPGHPLGVAAINWFHALLHVSYGVLALEISQLHRSRPSRAFMGLRAVFWGAMAVMGWRATGVDHDIHIVMGMALNAGANVVHTAWSGIGPAFVLWPDALRSTENET